MAEVVTRHERLTRLIEQDDILPRICGVQLCEGFASHFRVVEDGRGTRYHPRCERHAQAAKLKGDPYVSD